ncbi:uncharacterized protein LOC143519235 isoform X2 [Brachyhypopomus gauderio]|uniref:uncharacterized protein LOC143519235 isoform X2 n=1 Tax=Brachyhypopomus gauderio TaxID=698409 RepID=UPI00404252B7
MELRSRWFWTVIFMQVLAAPTGRSVAVRFLNRQLVHVVIGQDLVLQAELDLPPGDRVTKVTWEHEARKGASGRTTVAEFPAGGPDGRTRAEENGAVLRVRNYQREDGGVYSITVTDQRGSRGVARCTVEDYEAVHHVSVMVNVSHSSLHCQEAWGTDPVFTWLHEKASVTAALGRVSADGSSLYLDAPLCGHFTCVVSNILGQSSDTYTAEPCEEESHSLAVAVVCLMFLLLVVGGLAFLLWRKHGQHNNRMESFMLC